MTLLNFKTLVLAIFLFSGFSFSVQNSTHANVAVAEMPPDDPYFICQEECKEEFIRVRTIVEMEMEEAIAECISLGQHIDNIDFRCRNEIESGYQSILDFVEQTYNDCLCECAITYDQPPC